MRDTFVIINKTRSSSVRTLADGFPFAEMKNAVLGTSYELELIFIGPKESHKINFAHRGKDNPTNILSFPLTPTSGQIFICLLCAKKEAPRFDRAFSNYIAFLFIHGLVHLKGFDHGSRMEAEEQKIRKHFGI